jgi:hypothetical protein
MKTEREQKFNYLMEVKSNCGTLYPLDTLINGNVKECIKVLKLMAELDTIALHKNLEAIKANSYTKNKYEYILNQVNKY